MRIRRAAVAVAVLGAVTVPAAATGVVAFAHSSSAAASTVVASGSQGPKKPSKTAKFTASGLVTAVDVSGATVTVAAKGGTKGVRGRTVTVAVPSAARITLNHKRVDLSALAAGQRITVTGTRAADVLTAARIQAKGKSVGKPSPSPSTEPPENPEDDD